MFKRIFKNWKTSLAGIAAITGGIKLIVDNNIEAGVTAIITGLGLFAAKDGNVTGGTKAQDGATPSAVKSSDASMDSSNPGDKPPGGGH
jgi:hypothetical protein